MKPIVKKRIIGLAVLLVIAALLVWVTIASENGGIFAIGFSGGALFMMCYVSGMELTV